MHRMVFSSWQTGSRRAEFLGRLRSVAGWGGSAESSAYRRREPIQNAPPAGLGGKIGVVMKLSDYVADFLAAQGIKHVFAITGGASIHLIHSIADHSGVDFIC